MLLPSQGSSGVRSPRPANPYWGRRSGYGINFALFVAFDAFYRIEITVAPRKAPISARDVKFMDKMTFSW